jgi:ectoine hydroxylase-related dioxygenase (phytanoyl-CoA dioxygenase family)
MLSEEQLETFAREGYLVIPGLVPTAEIDRVMEAMPKTVGKSETWEPIVFDHSNIHKDARLHSLLVSPHIIEAVEDIFTVPARVYYGMVAVVSPRGGRGLAWHQDNQYDQIVGAALNTFIALCDITPEKCNLWIAPKTHLLGTQPSVDADGHKRAAVDPENGQLLPTLNRGDVCIFDRNTYHRSLKNETDEIRYAYAAQYQADYARKADTGKKDPLKMRAKDLLAHWQSDKLI